MIPAKHERYHSIDVTHTRQLDLQEYCENYDAWLRVMSRIFVDLRKIILTNIEEERFLSITKREEFLSSKKS